MNEKAVEILNKLNQLQRHLLIAVINNFNMIGWHKETAVLKFLDIKQLVDAKDDFLKKEILISSLKEMMYFTIEFKKSSSGLFSFLDIRNNNFAISMNAFTREIFKN